MSAQNGNDRHIAAEPAKRGRRTLRKIRRPKGDKKEYAERNNGSVAPEESDGISQEGESQHPKPAKRASGQEEANKSVAYGALLTLLKSEHPEDRRKDKKQKRRKIDETPLSAEVVESPDAEEKIESDEELSENDENDSENESDPFESHFNTDLESINAVDQAWKHKKVIYRSKKVSVDKNESLIYARPLTDGNQSLELPPHHGDFSPYFIKQKLRIKNDLLGSQATSNLTPLQKKIVDPIFQYRDLLYEYEDDEADEDQYRSLYALHVLNHIYKTRAGILKHSQRLASNPDNEFLDQGFTRPKVLIVVPTRDAAYRIVMKIIESSGLDQVDKKSKLKDQFFEDVLPPPSKPKSFRHIFRGNTNDFFVLGVKFTRKAIRLYSNFYQSDLIVCSPLGLQLILENTDCKKRQDDFLSSIELMIIDQLNCIEFQNVSHLFTIFDHINKIPTEQHDTDFSRVRMWYINNQAYLLRQTLIFTRYITPTANFILNGKCRNIAGRYKNHYEITNEECSISKLGIRVRQIFQRIDLGGASVADEPDYRFRFFTSVIIPRITKSTDYEDGILIYIPDYTDFVRIKNHLKDNTTVLYGEINEYSEVRHLTSTRSLFQQGRLKVLLYTERLHHFRRYEINGVKSVIFYQPPSNPEFYNEVVRYIGKSAFLGSADLNISTVRCLYSKLDALALERIVSSKKAAVLSHGQNEIYEFK